MRSRFQFVDDRRGTYEVKRLCQVLDVNRSSYYKWLAGAEARAARQHQDRILAEEIREINGESGGAYGSPRVTAELREKGRRVNEKRVTRIMRTFSIPHGPQETELLAAKAACSPHARGWSRGHARARARPGLLPARAGMVPSASRTRACAPPAPRTRGDGPPGPNGC